MIDRQGKIFGRISLVDIIIVLAILLLIAGLVYRRATPRFADMLRPDDTFYITLEVNRIRNIIAEDSVIVGDMLFRQHERLPLGRIVSVERHPATEILLRRSDGTAILAEMEERYMLLITVEATGSVTERGYFINGIDHIAPNSGVQLVSRTVFLPTARVHSITRDDV